MSTDDVPFDKLPLAEIVRRRIRAILERLGSYRASHLYKRVLDEVERVLIEEALLRTKGSQKNAALILGIHRNTLRLRMKKLGIKAKSRSK